MHVTALLTGRGNSTLPNKNVIDILGKPVLYYAAKAAKNSVLVNDWYCSSDDGKILEAAETLGYKRILRPKELALPASQHIECIMHALEMLKLQNITPDILVVILANNVTVKSKWITECIEQMQYNYDRITAVVPVYEDNDHHPLRAKILNIDGTLSMYDNNSKGVISSNRQDLSSCYFLSHNFWVLNVNNILSNKPGQPPWTFMGDCIYPYIVDESIDIHSEQDLLFAKMWIEANYSE